MPVKFFGHTADVGAHLVAPTFEAPFVEAATALTETLCDPCGIEPRLSRAVTVHAPDVDQLLVEWLSEPIRMWLRWCALCTKLGSARASPSPDRSRSSKTKRGLSQMQ